MSESPNSWEKPPSARLAVSRGFVILGITAILWGLIIGFGYLIWVLVDG